MEKAIKSEDSFDESIEKFKKLKELDKQLCDRGYSLFKSILLLRKIWFSEKQPNSSKIIGLAGSTSEGSAIARIFKPNNEFDDGLNRELEIDVEIVFLEIPPELRNNIEDVPGKIGYVNVRVCPEVLMFTNNADLDGSKKYVEEYLTKISAAGLGHPYNVKNFALEKFKFSEKRKLLEIVCAAIYDKKISDISFRKTDEVTNASVGSELTIQIKNKNTVKLSIDLVTLIRIAWWPDVASEWKVRERKWPNNQRTIDDLTQTCHIIAKPSAADKGNKEALDWRYSFSNVERELFSLYNPQQKLIYFIFKAMFYKWLKPISPTQLSSFIGKNVMLKAAEDFPPQNHMWNESHEAIKEALNYLFFQMQVAFESGCLPYYFINKINVIETIDPEVKKEVIQNIQCIRSNIEKRIPSNVNDVLAFVEDVIQKLTSFDRIVSNLGKKNYSDFINLQFLGSNLDFLFDKIVLSFLKDAIEIKNVEERVYNKVTRTKSPVHTEEIEIENYGSEKTKCLSNKLAAVAANVDPAIPNAVHHEALNVEAKAINEVKRVAGRVENELARVEKRFHKYFDFKGF